MNNQKELIEHLRRKINSIEATERKWRNKTVIYENYFVKKDDLKYFLIREINKKIKEAGNDEVLSKNLNQGEKYVYSIVDSGSFQDLERLWKLLYNIEEPGNENTN